MAYITSYNFNKVFDSRYRNDNSKRFDGTIVWMERIIDFYSDGEIQRLLAYQAFVKDPVAFLGLFRVTFRDTYTFVWENPPAYHNHSSCEFLHSDFSGKGAVCYILDEGSSQTLCRLVFDGEKKDFRIHTIIQNI